MFKQNFFVIKSFIISSLLLIVAPGFSQLHNGFDKNEARDMIAICNSFTFLDLYNSDAEILPKGYVKEYTSGVFGMDNLYQIYLHKNIAVINLRGSTDKQLSWIANINAAMIPASGEAEVDGEKLHYSFAKHENAAIHSGFALAIFYLRKDLIYQIKNLNKQGIHDFIITGHSQGGALANMLRAYLENYPGDISTKNHYKTYAFAAPMTGNKYFAFEYESKFCSDSSSFNIINVEDPIPSMPLSYNDSSSALENLSALLFNRDSFNMKRILIERGLGFFDDKINAIAQRIGASANKKIASELGPVKLPDYVEGFNYSRLNCTVELHGFQYPKILKDSTILKNDSLMAIYDREENGDFMDKKLYESGSWGYQHKPYNYYVAVLEKYFPADYKKLKKKYLSENL